MIAKPVDSEGQALRAMPVDSEGQALRAMRAPAKLNLGLRIVGRRPDGYHLLESVFVPLDLEDRLEVRVDPDGSGISLRVDGGSAELADPERNLAARAARAFLDAAGLRASVGIVLEKRIPVGAGLGGGSSDAAALLRVLATVFPRALGPEALRRLALDLGADVPFFLDPRPARVAGIGERIEPIPGWPELPVLVVTPARPLATRAVFEAWDREAAAHPSPALTPSAPGRNLALPSDPQRIASPERVLAAAPVVAPVGAPAGDRELRALLANDLEAVASRLQPAIGRLRGEIERSGARAVGMSGSGPSVFGVFRDLRSAEIAAGRGRFEASDRVHVGRALASWGVV